VAFRPRPTILPSLTTTHLHDNRGVKEKLSEYPAFKLMTGMGRSDGMSKTYPTGTSPSSRAIWACNKINKNITNGSEQIKCSINHLLALKLLA